MAAGSGPQDVRENPRWTEETGGGQTVRCDGGGERRPVGLQLTPELWQQRVQGGRKAKSSLSKVQREKQREENRHDLLHDLKSDEKEYKYGQQMSSVSSHFSHFPI